MADVIAVDVGGTKLAAGVVRDDGTLVARGDAPTPRDVDADDAVRDARAASSTGSTRRGARRGRRRLRRPDGRGGEHVSPLNIPAWRGFPLRARLAAHTGAARCGSTTTPRRSRSAKAGSARPPACATTSAMVVSTGVGGGIVLDGRLLDGARGNAGHIGHVIVEPDGRECGCGARGCLEAEASGIGDRAHHRRAARPTRRPRCASAPGTLVGRAVASVANLLDLPLAVVSGSVALGFGEPFFAAAQAEIDARCRLDFSRGTRIVPGALGADGPLIGAAAVALSRLRAPVSRLDDASLTLGQCW